jgi:hypothetical protein
MTLFGTYYIGANAIIGAFGAATIASAMIGPIGLGIAIGVCLGIGLFFAYKCYQTCKENEKTKKYEKILCAQLDTKYKKCHQLHEKVLALRNPHHHPVDHNDRVVKFPFQAKASKTPYRFFNHPMLSIGGKKKVVAKVNGKQFRM